MDESLTRSHLHVHLKQSDLAKKLNFGTVLDENIKLRFDVLDILQHIEYKYLMYKMKKPTTHVDEHTITLKYLHEIFHSFKHKYVSALDKHHEVEKLKIMKYEINEILESKTFNDM